MILQSILPVLFLQLVSLDFLLLIFVYISVSIYACCMRQYSFLKPRFKIDTVIMIICSIVIIINSVLTLQVSTAKPIIVDLAK